VVIPVGSEADVVVPKEDEMTEVTIREGEQIVWEKAHYVAGVAGIATGNAKGRDYIFRVGSGRYSFKLTGE
jgi:hypothetical protein